MKLVDLGYEAGESGGYSWWVWGMKLVDLGDEVGRSGG